MEDAKRQTLARIVRAGAEEMLPRQLALLEQLCAIDSGTGNEAGNAAVIGLLMPVLSELGARTERVTESGLGTHLVVRVRPERPRGKVLLAAHLDTVFGPGFAEKHPFHIEGEWAHGLGAGDCKSGVLISLFGALILKKAGLLPPWELTYLFTCDEETGSRSGRKVYAREAQGADLALVFEGGRERDGRPRFVTSRRGVILGAIDVEGREAHAGKAYLEGRSAVLELAHQIIRLYSFNDYEKGIYYNVAPISGGRPNGVVAGAARGEFCVAGIPENADFPVIQAKLDSMADQVTVEGCRVQVTYRTLFPAMERNAANHRAYLRAAEAAELLGWEPEEIADPAATDGAYLSTFGGDRRFRKTHIPPGRRIEFGIDSDRGGSVMAARHAGRRIGTVSSQHRAAERRRRSTPAAPRRVQRGKRETLTPGERRHLIQLVACGSIFVLLVAVKLLLPGRMAQVNARLTGMLEQNIDVQAVFSAVGRAVSGEADVDVALQDMYQAVFDPQEDSAVEVSAPAGGEAVSLQLPAAIAPLRAFRTGTGSSDGWLDLPAAASQTAETAQTAEADQTAETAETASQGAAEASTLAYVLYSDQNLPDNVCLEQALLGFDYCTPVMGTLTSDFGYREHPVEGEERFHYGIDIGAAAGTEIGCFADGTVTAVGESSSYGKYITVAHEGGYSTLYAHCSRIIASSGASVKEGDVIAEVGETGVATGPHLHFELHEGSQYLNPIYYVSLA